MKEKRTQGHEITGSNTGKPRSHPVKKEPSLQEPFHTKQSGPQRVKARTKWDSNGAEVVEERKKRSESAKRYTATYFCEGRGKGQPKPRKKHQAAARKHCPQEEERKTTPGGKCSTLQEGNPRPKTREKSLSEYRRNLGGFGKQREFLRYG